MLNVSSIGQDLHTNTKKLLSGEERTSNEVVKPRSTNRSSWLTQFSGKLLASIALFAPIVGTGRISEAANIPEIERAIASLAEESWTEINKAISEGRNLEDIPNIDSLWNNVQAVMHVTDDTMVESVEGIRTPIIKEGDTNPDIPAKLVHGAIYTSAVNLTSLNNEIHKNETQSKTLTEELNALNEKAAELLKANNELPVDLKEKRIQIETQIGELNQQNKSLELRLTRAFGNLTPYLGKVIVDTETLDGRRERHLVSPQEVKNFKGRYPSVEVYEGKDFHRLASYALAQIGDQSIFAKAANEMLASENNIDRRNMFFDVFLFANENTQIPESVIKKSQEWVYMPAAPVTPPPAAPTTTPQVILPLGIVPFGSTTPTVNQTNPDDSTPAVSSLEEIKKISSDLVSPVLRPLADKSEQEKEFIANNILLLAKRDDKAALPAIAQWFANKTYAQGAENESRSSTKPSADFTVLETLAHTAKKNDMAFEILCRVAASHPNLFSRALMFGSWATADSPERRAGIAILDTFNSHREAAKNLITEMTDREAKLIWPEPTTTDDTEHVAKIRDSGHRAALLVMTDMSLNKTFVPYLREILNDPFSSTEDKFETTIGLANAKDKESIDALLALGIDKTVDDSLSSLAIEAALFIDAPDLIPDSIQKKVAEQTPFSAVRLQHYFPLRATATNENLDSELEARLNGKMVNPFHIRIASLYNDWLVRQQKIREESAQNGGEPIAISEIEKLEMLNSLYRREFGGTQSVLSSKASDVKFRDQYLTPMVKYLSEMKNDTGPRDISLAMAMMSVLSKANSEEASTVFADMIKSPHLYAADESADDFFSILFNAFDSATLKMVAIQELGGTIDLSNENDPAAKVLHRVARKESSRFYRQDAQMALRALARRYETAMSTAQGDELNKLTQARNFHANEVLGHMTYHGQGLEGVTQIDRVAMTDEFNWAKIIDMLGGRKELLTIAHGEANPKAQIVRSVCHALQANGCKVEDLASLGFEPNVLNEIAKMFNFVNEQQYWLGNATDLGYTGKGVELALIDGGIVIHPDLENVVIRSENIPPNDLLSVDEHPQATAGTFHERASDAKIWTYSFTASNPEVPFRPMDTQDAAIFALEDLAQKSITGEANIDLVNYSWGYVNFILTSKKSRTEIIDELSAFMAVLSTIGAKHTVSAGNGHGDELDNYPPIGELNNLGLRFDNDGTPHKPDSVFISSAMDAYRNMIAEFSSKPNVLDENPLPMLSSQGVHVMAPWTEDGRWVLEPVDGTSFSAPGEAGVIALGIEAREKAGLPPLSDKELQEMLHRTAKQLPGREASEGGLYIDAEAFLAEVIKPPVAQNQ